MADSLGHLCRGSAFRCFPFWDDRPRVLVASVDDSMIPYVRRPASPDHTIIPRCFRLRLLESLIRGERRWYVVKWVASAGREKSPPPSPRNSTIVRFSPHRGLARARARVHVLGVSIRAVGSGGRSRRGLGTRLSDKVLEARWVLEERCRIVGGQGTAVGQVSALRRDVGAGGTCRGLREYRDLFFCFIRKGFLERAHCY